MKNSLLAGFALAVCAGMLPVPHGVQAAPSAVQQCRTSDGSAVYTDKPCRSIGAQSVPMRGELMTQILREGRREAQVSGVEVATIPVSLATMSAARDAIDRRSAAGGCARTPTQLAMDVRGAFALGDVNRIAESYHWVGMSQRAANATMQRLERLAKHPVLDTHYYDAQISSGAWIASSDDTADFGGNAGVLQVQFGEGAVGNVQDFDVERYAGCYFMRF
jgi:hypothetical protein